MTTMRSVRNICNHCKSEGMSEEELWERPTKRYVIMAEGRHCTLDLCATHGAPLEVLFQLKPPDRYPRVKTGRRRSLPSQKAAKTTGRK